MKREMVNRERMKREMDEERGGEDEERRDEKSSLMVL